MNDEDILLLAFFANIAAHGIAEELKQPDPDNHIPSIDRERMEEMLDRLPSVFAKVVDIEKTQTSSDLSQMGMPTIN